MADWIGLLPVLAFVMTVGIPVPVTLTAYLFYRSGARPFTRTLQVAFLEAGLFYALGVYVLWSIGAGISRVVTLLIVGAMSLILLVAMPLIIGQQFAQYMTEVDSETALRYTTYSWPLAMFVVFGIFVIPGGIHRVTFFHIGGMDTCLLGFCQISVLSVGAVLLQVLVAFFGPGIISVIQHSRRQ